MTDRARPYTLLLAFLLLVCAVMNWTGTVLELVRFYTNLHFWDAFDWLPNYARYQNFDWRVLWVQHNEHREIGTELLFAADMLWFHGRQILPTVAGVLAYIGVLVVLARAAVKEWDDRLTAACAICTITAFAGYKICVVSLTIPFLTSWPQWEFFGTAALWAAALYGERRRAATLVVCILCAVAATYSMSNGMLVWPLLIIAGLVLRFSKPALAALTLSAAVSIGAFFYHYQNRHSLAIGTTVSHPLYLAGFIGNFIGMPFSAGPGFSKPWNAAAFGWLALLLVALDVVLIVRKRKTAAPLVVVAGGYILLVLASALLTATGRMDPGDKYFQAARAGRYITEPILFWCALVILTAWLLKDVRGSAVTCFLTAFGIFSSLALSGTHGYYTGWEEYFQHDQWAAIAVANQVVDDEVAAIVFPAVDEVPRNLPMLVANHLDVFADPESGWVGRNLKDEFELGQDNYFHGEITSVRKRGPNYEVQGWADGPKTFVFADESGRILGFGMLPRAGVEKLYTHDVPRKLAFAGFIQGRFGANRFCVYAVDHRGHRMTRMGQLWNPLSY